MKALYYQQVGGSTCRAMCYAGRILSYEITTDAMESADKSECLREHAQSHMIQQQYRSSVVPKYHSVMSSVYKYYTSASRWCRRLLSIHNSMQLKLG